jgi:hypothetical protein
LARRRSEYFFWEIVILIRKFSFVLVVLITQSNPHASLVWYESWRVL